MTEIKVTKSKRFKMMEDGQFVNQFLLSLGREFQIEWDKESQSTDFWRKGAYTVTKNFGRVIIAKPLRDRLTVCSGVLIGALKADSPHAIRNVTLKSDGVVSVFKGVKASVPYANRQERQLGGQRSYVGRAMLKLLSKIETIKKRALRKMNFN